MKKLVIIAALVAAPAFADNELAYTSNKAGGSIIFTYSRCVYISNNEPIPNNFYVYSTDKYGNKGSDGCYEYKYPFYIVKWNGGGRLTVNINTVTILK